MDPTLELLWTRFRKWDLTSNRLRDTNDGWKRRVILLTLAGTALGALAPFAGAAGGGPWPARAMGMLGALCLALATYFAKELLDSQHAERRARARMAAEAFKSEACKYLVQAPPYNGPDRASHVVARLPALEAITKAQLPDAVSDVAAKEGMPTGTWAITDYIEKRLDDQISWYRKRAGDHGRSMKKGRAITLTLGGLAVLLSGATSAAAQDGTLPAALLGVVTTAGGAIGAYLQASHFEAIALRYSETADTLERMRVEFSMPSADTGKLITDTEGIMQAEQATWLTEQTAKTA
jgi:hypothetical protein